MQPNNVLPYRRKVEKKSRGKTVGLLFIFFALALFAYYLASPLALVDRVDISGNSRLKDAEILSIAGLGPGLHMWRLPLKSGRDKLLANPWVAEAEIQKQFPNTLIIRVRERTAVAIARSESGNWVLADDGVVLAENMGFSLPWLTGLELGPLSLGAGVTGDTVQLALAWAKVLEPSGGQISEISFESYPALIAVYTTDGYKALFNSFAAPTDKVQDFILLTNELRRVKQKGIMDFRGLQGRGTFVPWPAASP